MTDIYFASAALNDEEEGDGSPDAMTELAKYAAFLEYEGCGTFNIDRAAIHRLLDEALDNGGAIEINTNQLTFRVEI